jgi:hypothetical protein
MARILLFEKDEFNRNLIKEKIAEISQDIEVMAYEDFSEFDSLTANMTEEEIQNQFKFDVVIFDYNLKEPAVWTATLAQYRKKFGADTPYCFTAFDSVTVNRKSIFNQKIFNIFYKPFDHMILKESINLALKAKSDAQLIEMKPQSVDGLIGILKEVELLSICEIGFLTLSDRPLDVNSTSKYFSRIFSHGKRRSSWAQCLSSKPVPNMPDRYVNQFHFVGLDQEALKILRQFLRTNKANKKENTEWISSSTSNKKSFNIGVIATSADFENSIFAQTADHFNNVKVECVELDFSKPITTKLDQYDAVINTQIDLNIEEIKKVFHQDTLFFFMMLNAPLTEEQFVENQTNYRDIFSYPLDKGFFYRKLKLFIPSAELKEPLDLLNVTTSEKIKASVLVKLSEISELYLKFQYPRELQFGEFREFAFIIDDENHIVELPAYCNTSTPGKTSEGKNIFDHQFIFWGMTDHYLKEIRVWILKNYVSGSEES